MNVVIAGYGVEGKSNLKYFAGLGHTVSIADERPQIEDVPPGIQTILGDGAFSQLQDFDVVIRTAGLNPHKIKTNGKIWSATNEFFARCPAPIIGVTGSKGKGTTCSLAAEILKAAGKTVHLVGNIGVAALDVLPSIKPGDIVVYELSSFQLWDAVKSPHVAVLLHIEPDHLDVHADMDEYLHAKANIRIHQMIDDICFYQPDNAYDQKIIDMPADRPQNDFEKRDWRFRAYHFGVENKRSNDVPAVYLNSDIFCIQRPGEQSISTIHTSALKIPGHHNRMNACAAISAALMFDGVTNQAIEQGLSSFHGLPHRLKLVREVEGAMYYDDSIATTPGSSIAAMRAFQQPKVMILGGSSKGAQFSELAKVAAESDVRCVIAIGQEAATIEAALSTYNVFTLNIGQDVAMPTIVQLAHERAQAGDAVILSPACASFDMFKSYSDRGDQFIAAVNEL